jgi:hypothetical protein
LKSWARCPARSGTRHMAMLTPWSCIKRCRRSWHSATLDDAAVLTRGRHRRTTDPRIRRRALSVSRRRPVSACACSNAARECSS